jgi:hypothetical protein
VPIPNAQHQESHSSSPVEATSKKASKQKAARNQKIDGMEFYEWAELIRSSSL